MSAWAEIVVVGGGAMGSAAAWQLAARGHEVVLLERFGPGHTEGASHGASRIFRRTYADATYIALARESYEWWRELERETGTSVLTLTGGVDHGADPRLDDLAGSMAVAGEDHAWLSPAEAAERWPGLRFDTRVLHTPASGRLHADRAVAALQQAATQHGAVVRHHARVLDIVPAEHHVSVVTEGTTYAAERVVVAAGAWAHALLGGLVPLPRIRVTQEQPAHFPTDLPLEDWPSFVHAPAPAGEFGGTYGLATPGEGVKVGFHGVGPVVDPDARDKRAEPRQLAALQDYARTWMPGVDADRPAPISCTYATTPDENFVVDRHGALVVAAGFSGHGFKFTPTIGRLTADLVEGVAQTPALFRLGAR